MWESYVFRFCMRKISPNTGQQTHLERVFEVVDVRVRAVAWVRAFRVQQLVRRDPERPVVARDAVQVLLAKHLPEGPQKRSSSGLGARGVWRGCGGVCGRGRGRTSGARYCLVPLPRRAVSTGSWQSDGCTYATPKS
jgi:hypothetical protein